MDICIFEHLKIMVNNIQNRVHEMVNELRHFVVSIKPTTKRN